MQKEKLVLTSGKELYVENDKGNFDVPFSLPDSIIYKIFQSENSLLAVDYFGKIYDVKTKELLIDLNSLSNGMDINDGVVLFSPKPFETKKMTRPNGNEYTKLLTQNTNQLCCVDLNSENPKIETKAEFSMDIERVISVKDGAVVVTQTGEFETEKPYHTTHSFLNYLSPSGKSKEFGYVPGQILSHFKTKKNLFFGTNGDSIYKTVLDGDRSDVEQIKWPEGIELWGHMNLLDYSDSSILFSSKKDNGETKLGIIQNDLEEEISINSPFFISCAKIRDKKLFFGYNANDLGLFSMKKSELLVPYLGESGFEKTKIPLLYEDKIVFELYTRAPPTNLEKYTALSI